MEVLPSLDIRFCRKSFAHPCVAIQQLPACVQHFPVTSAYLLCRKSRITIEEGKPACICPGNDGVPAGFSGPWWRGESGDAARPGTPNREQRVLSEGADLCPTEARTWSSKCDGTASFGGDGDTPAHAQALEGIRALQSQLCLWHAGASNSKPAQGRLPRSGGRIWDEYLLLRSRGSWGEMAHRTCSAGLLQRDHHSAGPANRGRGFEAPLPPSSPKGCLHDENSSRMLGEDRRRGGVWLLAAGTFTRAWGWDLPKVSNIPPIFCASGRRGE